MTDIHHYDRRYKAAIAGLSSCGLSARNQELILRFKDYAVLENLSKPRLIKYVEIMRSVARLLKKDMDEATAEDLKMVVSEIQQRDYSPWTKQIYKIMIKKFYKWHLGTKDYPEIVDWITIRVSKSEKRLPSEGELLTEDDVKKLISAAEHPRDKAFVSILWESGTRIGETGNLCMKNISFDDMGVCLTVRGKTGSRKIRLITSTPHLVTWVSNHPFRDNPEAPLWINIGTREHNKAMQYSNMKELLKLLFRKAGLKKRCNPHVFRHSRATFMANHLTEFQMNQYFGWVQGSDMPSTYVHLSGKDVDNAIYMMNGIKAFEKKEEQKLMPRICPRCDTINAFDAKHCNKCGGILDLKYAMELEERREKETKLRENSDSAMTQLFQDKEVQEFLAEKLRRMGIRV